MHRIKNKRRIVVSALASLLVFAAVGIGYYLFLESGKSAPSQPTAVGSPSNDGKELAIKPMEAVPAWATAPGTTSIALHMWVSSESTNTQQVRKLTVTPTVDATHAAAGCLASWFTVKGTLKIGEALAGGAAVPIAIAPSAVTEVLNGTEPNSPNGTLKYSFKEEAAVNQNACAGAEVTWNYTSTP
jgi:hypothetical protein